MQKYWFLWKVPVDWTQSRLWDRCRRMTWWASWATPTSSGMLLCQLWNLKIWQIWTFQASWATGTRPTSSANNQRVTLIVSAFKPVYFECFWHFGYFEHHKHGIQSERLMWGHDVRFEPWIFCPFGRFWERRTKPTSNVTPWCQLSKYYLQLWATMNVWRGSFAKSNCVECSKCTLYAPRGPFLNYSFHKIAPPCPGLHF